jgi:outer membrane protein OmpA-like peptidoglycan-associated protein
MTVYHYLLIFLLACLFLSFHSYTNKILYKKKKRLETEAGQLYESELWGEAKDTYLLLDSINPGNPEYQFRLGVIYYNSINKAKCLPYFQEAVRNGKSDPNINFYLARAYHFNLDFNQAIDYYEKALREDEAASTMTRKQKQEIRKHIEDCKLAAQFIQDPLLTPIENIGEPINSPYPEYVPLLTANEDMMIFTSRRPNTTGKSVDRHGQYMEDVYISHRMENGEWTEPDNNLNFNTRQHDACVGLSPDGKKLLLYRSDNGGDLYVTDFNGSRWTEPVALEEINTAHWESSACFSADGKYLYFTSDKPGGYGGSDIYRAEMEENGKFGNIKNLGPVINTEYDEDAPQIHSDGKTLFFSSKGHKGLGGYDIYSSLFHEETGSWETPRNIGYPINTPDDDIYFSLLSNGATGYFSSYRPDSFGEKDIYKITRPGAVATKFLMKMKLIDPFTGKDISARITITNTETGEEQLLNKDQIIQDKYVFPLEFETPYIFGIDAEGYRFKEKKIQFDYRADLFEYVMNVVPQREEIITLVDSTEYVEALKNSGLVGQINENGTLLNENFEASLGDDNNGGGMNSQENKVEIPLVADDSREENGDLNSPYTETDDGDHSDNKAPLLSEVGFQRMDLELKYSRSAKIQDKLIQSVQLSEEEAWIKQILENENHVIFLTRLDNRNKVVIPVIHFGFDQYSVKDTYKRYLSEIAGFVKGYETSDILISGHTDWIGTEEYNLQLSINRAKKVEDYLIEYGVESDKISIHGFGEALPLLSNETALGRKANRRASMMLIDLKDPKFQDEVYMDLMNLFGIDLTPENGYVSPLIVWEKLPVSIHFTENNAEDITKYSREQLRDLARYVMAVPYTLVLTGFEDGKEQNENVDLGQMRAWLAYKYLRSLGIPDERMVLIDRKDLESFFDVSKEPEPIQQRKVQFFLVKY